jgi:hypothetical protein
MTCGHKKMIEISDDIIEKKKTRRYRRLTQIHTNFN